MKIEISNGEIFDKLSILCIKKINIKDEEKLRNIDKELKELDYAVRLILSLLTTEEASACFTLFQQLLIINGDLWIIEDRIRRKEAEDVFDEEFIELARDVYKTNDVRADMKRRINIITQSNLTEEKSYVDYRN